MKDIVRLGVILMIYAGIAGALLGWVYTKTEPKIEEQARLEKERAIREVLPADVKTYEEVKLSDGTPVFVGYADEAKTKIAGYAVEAVGAGFSSNPKTMVGLTPDFRINAIKVIYQNETPGLGTHTQDDWFQAQFSGKTVDDLWVDKDGGKIQSITGATISSRAITNSVREAIEKLMKDPALPKPTAASADSAVAQNEGNEGGAQ